MTVRHVTPRPPIVEALEWTGSNFAEIEAFGNTWSFTAVDNGDGTITTSGPVCSGTNLPVGTWLISTYAGPQTPEAFANSFQVLPTDTGTSEYAITEPTP